MVIITHALSIAFAFTFTLIRATCGLLFLGHQCNDIVESYEILVYLFIHLYIFYAFAFTFENVY